MTITKTSDGAAMCPVCNNAGVLDEVEVVDSGRILLCGLCGLQFVAPMPEKSVFVDFSAAARELFKTLGEGGDLPSMLTPSESLALKWVTHNLKKGDSVFEICCEVGRFMEAARRRGISPYGVDPVSGHVELLVLNGFEVNQGLHDAFPDTLLAPKAVVLLESLVRFPDPVGLLQSIRTKFPKSYLIITVPSPRRSLKAPGFDRRSDYPPHHLTRWSHQSLTAALNRAGYSSKVGTTFINANSLEVPSIVRVLVRIAYRLIGEADYSYFAVARPKP
jgi:hypothetical protein